MAKILNVIQTPIVDNTIFVQQLSCDVYNAGSKLIVQESQEAILFKDGVADGPFIAGPHILQLENLPFFRKVFSHLFGGETPFKCKVYFINKANVLGIMWGTDAPIPLEDPKYGIQINVRSNGSTGISVIDSRRFVIKVVGTMQEFSIVDLKKVIKGFVVTFVKETLASAIAEQGISILNISAQLSSLSNIVQKKVNERLKEYGIQAENFLIGSILASDDDLEELKKIKNEALREVMIGSAKAQSRQIQGFNYQQERQFDVLEGAAKNGSGMAGTFVGTGVGLGVGLGVSGAVSNMANQAMSSQPQSNLTCPNCQISVPNGTKFCPNCGTKIEMPKNKFCSNCGTKLDPGAKFCPNCGNKCE